MSYLAYDSLVALFLGLGWGQSGIIFAQVLMSGIAADTLFLLGTHLYDRRAEFVAAFLYVEFPDLQKWDFYILTESLFISTLILTTYVVIACNDWKRVLLGGLLVLLATFLRPNGFIVPLALFLYVLSLGVAGWKATIGFKHYCVICNYAISGKHLDRGIVV